MSAGVAERQMGRKRSSHPRNDVTIKVDAEIVGKAKLIALTRGISVAELVSGILEEPISEQYNKTVLGLKSDTSKGKNTSK